MKIRHFYFKTLRSPMETLPTSSSFTHYPQFSNIFISLEYRGIFVLCSDDDQSLRPAPPPPPVEDQLLPPGTAWPAAMCLKMADISTPSSSSSQSPATITKFSSVDSDSNLCFLFISHIFIFQTVFPFNYLSTIKL